MSDDPNSPGHPTDTPSETYQSTLEMSVSYDPETAQRTAARHGVFSGLMATTSALAFRLGTGVTEAYQTGDPDRLFEAVMLGVSFAAAGYAGHHLIKGISNVLEAHRLQSRYDSLIDRTLRAESGSPQKEKPE